MTLENGALIQATGRADLVIRAGVTEKFGVYWENSIDGGRTFKRVNISGWTGVFVMRSSANDVLLVLPTIQSISGLAAVTINPDDTLLVDWQGRTNGNWYLNIESPDGRVERLADGYFILEG